jgi:glucose-1-phosphate adenylyltransferase
LRSILGPLCKVNSYSLVEDSILFEKVTVGRHAMIRKAIIDKNVVIPDGTTIGYNHDEDRSRGYTVTESGIVVVPRNEYNHQAFDASMASKSSFFDQPS